MNNIIPFPANADDYKNVRQWIADECSEAGLTDSMTKNVINEFQEYYDQLTTQYEARISLLDDLDMKQEQADAISKAHTKTVEGIFHHHAKQIALASNIIIGLLCRAQLNL
jgi:hypothetical protein